MKIPKEAEEEKNQNREIRQYRIFEGLKEIKVEN